MDSTINELLASLRPKGKEPRSRSVLESWIAHADTELDSDQHGRIGWLIATTVATAALQRVVDSSGTARFSLKGGTLLQHRLGLTSRSTRDVDGIVRGDIDEFVTALDDSLREDWGAIHFSRSEVETIVVPARTINPRRFELILEIRGKVWRRVPIEISPDEGHAASSQEPIEAPPLDRFGLPTPSQLVGLSMSYQIAQKLHAASDPHDPPVYVNRRARDLVDLLLLKDLVEASGAPTLIEIREACVDIFNSRADEARTLGRISRTWPCTLQAYDHWSDDYRAAASDCAIDVGLDEAITVINQWVESIDRA